MKKITAVLLCLLLIFLCSCNSTKNEETTKASAEETTIPEEITTVESLEIEELDPAQVLTVYFTHNDPIPAAATYISELTEGGLYKIETLGEYPEDEAELVKKAAEEYNNNVRPALKNAPTDMLEYDVVFLCFPAWNYTMPMALWTFIEDYDMRDKAVLPVIYGTETELYNAMRDIQSMAPSLMLADGFNFTSDFSDCEEEFNTWLNTVLYG